jgi:hypothetical protein
MVGNGGDFTLHLTKQMTKLRMPHTRPGLKRRILKRPNANKVKRVEDAPNITEQIRYADSGRTKKRGRLTGGDVGPLWPLNSVRKTSLCTTHTTNMNVVL